MRGIGDESYLIIFLSHHPIIPLSHLGAWNKNMEWPNWKARIWLLLYSFLAFIIAAE
jgi:hypothetical protein